ncbi:MAG TPA: hypothetical protein VN037_12195 [Verrucomicrobiae bacterium]|nr:hypothetical protein [Verrucomicrobiae bacterium]
MKRALLLVLAAASCAFAQEKGNVIYQTTGTAGIVASGGFDGGSGPVVGAPYSATTSNESIQTLADGNRLVQTSTGTTARDSQGRTRQETVLPTIGNLSAANAPHLIFIHDPVAQTSYTLNLTDKTAQKMPTLPPLPGGAAGVGGAMVTMRAVESSQVPLPPADAMPTTIAAAPAPGVFLAKHLTMSDQDQGNTEDLGSQSMEGVLVNGIRMTHTIPAGQIGNDLPITIVTEVWTSPDLKTVVYSKRSDPRMGEQTFRLTNIVRTEPSALLFTVPADFKIVDGPQPIFYRTKQ